MEILRRHAVDLHTHTSHSDGDLSVGELLLRAEANDVSALAITDHDTVDAFLFDQDAITKTSLVVLAGIELSTETETASHHILGLDINPNADSISGVIDGLKQARFNRAGEIVDLLRVGGWEVDNEVLSFRGAITKPQIARGMLDAKNSHLLRRYTGTENPTIGQLIEATLIQGKPFFVPKDQRLHPLDAVRAIHESGGMAVLAHPSFNIIHGRNPRELFEESLHWGVDGIEGIYIQFDRSDQDRPHEHRRIIDDFCKEHGLVVTGGSDFHTTNSTMFGTVIDLGFYGHDWFVATSVLEDVLGKAAVYK